jgi:hypothetical protein
VHQSSAIALQAPAGLLFGNVTRIRSDALTFEVEGEIPEGAIVEWRMELTGHNDTVMGSLKVLRVRVQPDGVFRCSSRITAMPAKDRERLARWLDEQATGGTTRRYDSDVSVITQSSHTTPVTQAETRNALERMDQRTWYSPSQTSQTRDMLGLQSEVKTDAGQKSGRAALRSALRTSMARKKASAISPPPPPREEITEAVRRPDPELTREPNTDPPRIAIRYFSESVYRSDHTRHIRCSALFIPMPDLGGDGTRLELTIQPPGRAPVACRAEIKVQMPSGVGVALRLSREQKTELEP